MYRVLTAIASVFFFAPAVSFAAPVFLNCTVDSVKGDITKVDVQLNEESGIVNYSFPDAGRSYTVRGMFSATQVAFNGFVVDRSNLKFARSNNGEFDQTVLHLALVDHGVCVIDKRARAF